MVYLVTNESGNTSTVTEKLYNRLKDKPEYECRTVEPDYPSSTDYTVREVREMASDMDDEQLKRFTRNDERKTVKNLL